MGASKSNGINRIDKIWEQVNQMRACVRACVCVCVSLQFANFQCFPIMLYRNLVFKYLALLSRIAAQY